jgi:hypothetical protein
VRCGTPLTLRLVVDQTTVGAGGVEMSAHAPGRHSEPSTTTTSTNTIGPSLFGATVLILQGGFQILQGIALLFDDTVFVTRDDYVYELDPSTWGWIQIVLGVLAISIAVGILAGATLGYITGVILASFSALANFAFIPLYPVWALVIIALDVAVVWALSSLIRADRPVDPT